MRIVARACRIAALPVRALPFTALLSLLIAGCTSPTAANPNADASSVQLILEGVPVTRNSIIGMFPGTTTLHLHATIKGSGGQILSSAHATLVSRNPSAITIDSTGALRVVGRGSSWLVGAYVSTNRGVLADSVTVSTLCNDDHSSPPPCIVASRAR